eukprot:223817-Chlamydomonas_euryale.AAC.8
MCGPAETEQAMCLWAHSLVQLQTWTWIRVQACWLEVTHSNRPRRIVGVKYQTATGFGLHMNNVARPRWS